MISILAMDNAIVALCSSIPWLGTFFSLYKATSKMATPHVATQFETDGSPMTHQNCTILDATCIVVVVLGSEKLLCASSSMNTTLTFKANEISPSVTPAAFNQSTSSGRRKSGVARMLVLTRVDKCSRKVAHLMNILQRPRWFRFSPTIG
jgi:hypothetical protein